MISNARSDAGFRPFSVLMSPSAFLLRMLFSSCSAVVENCLGSIGLKFASFAWTSFQRSAMICFTSSTVAVSGVSRFSDAGFLPLPANRELISWFSSDAMPVYRSFSSPEDLSAFFFISA